MVNMLVIEDNFHFSKALINIVVQEIPQVRLCKIATDGQDALDFLMNNTNNVDIILLDLQLPNLNGLEFINRLEKFNYNKYENSIIVISGQIELLNKVRNSPFLYTYIKKATSFDKIIAEINDLSELKQNKLAEKNILELINRELHTLSYKENLSGTKYLRETINLIATNDFTSENLKNTVYPLIAKKYNKSVNNIKCNINHATEVMNCTCRSDVIKDYFVFYDDFNVVTPKQVIDTILNKISQKAR